jgi:hypothetical protein
MPRAIKVFFSTRLYSASLSLAKLKGSFQRHRRVRYDARLAKIVFRGRMEHERMQEYHISDFSYHFHKVITLLDLFKV